MLPWIESRPSREDVGRNPRPDAQVQLDELTDELLRLALHAESGSETRDTHVREALRRACDAAHARDVRAEELLILIKARWNRLPEATRLRGPDKDELLARVISSCIRAFYSGGATDVRDRLVDRMQALLDEIDKCEPGEEDWW